jgi:hypothetical protein
MRIVIQCAARKDASAGSLRMADAREVLFVAHPNLAPADPVRQYARPDDPSDDGRTWRERLVAYNAASNNPLNLLPAYRLYAHDWDRSRCGCAPSRPPRAMGSGTRRRQGEPCGRLPIDEELP